MSDRLYDMGQISRAAEIERLRARLARSDADLDSACKELADAKDALLSAQARLAEAEYNMASAHKGWNNTIDAHSRTAARLAEAEALLRSARFAIAIAITYSVKPEAKTHYRKLLTDTDAFLTPADSTPAAPCPLQGPKSAVVPTVCPVCNNDISKCTLVVSTPDQPKAAK